jgi:hypothetical protein
MYRKQWRGVFHLIYADHESDKASFPSFDTNVLPDESLLLATADSIFPLSFFFVLLLAEFSCDPILGVNN